VKARATSQANACINNLRQMEGAVNQFALEMGKKTGDAWIFNDISAYIKMNTSPAWDGSLFPQCPAGGIYTVVNPIGVEPMIACSLGNTVTPGHFLP
jgi:hypothetical protein